MSALETTGSRAAAFNRRADAPVPASAPGARPTCGVCGADLITAECCDSRVCPDCDDLARSEDIIGHAADACPRSA
jgi:hypothetical protein